MVHLLKPTDVARQLNVSPAWVYEAAKDGRIPSVRIGGRDGPLRFVPDDIGRWLQEACRLDARPRAPEQWRRSRRRSQPTVRRSPARC